MRSHRQRSTRGLFLAIALALLGAGVMVASASANNYLGQEGAQNPSFYAHWGRGSLPIAAWRVEDYTGPRWPVFAAQIDWNRSRALASLYVPGGTCARDNLSRCVPARERRISPGDLCGDAFACFVYNGLEGCCTRAGHFTGGRRNHYILYNNATTRGFTFNQRWATTCQEQGHATGLGHRRTKRSCMFQDASQTPSHHPDGHDFFMLREKIYNH